MKELVATVVIAAILFFLSCGNALSFRFTNNSVRSFRLRRREYLTQVLKQVSATSKLVKSRVGSIVQKSSNAISFRTQKDGHFHKNAWIWQPSCIEILPLQCEIQENPLLSLLNGPPLLRPPIA